MSRYTSITIFLFAIIIFGACKKNEPEDTKPQLEIPEKLMADLGDTIKLAGQNLPSDVKIIIDDNLAEILKNDENVLIFVMPDQLPKAVATINIIYPGKDEALKYPVTLNPPQVSGFSGNASYGDPLTISGDHFDSGPYRTRVKFDDSEARVTSISKKTLKVIVPLGISAKEPVIYVTAQHQTVQATIKFNLPAPQFIRVPEGGYTNTSVVITGKNFSPVPANNHLFLDGIEVPVSVSSTLQLEFMLPNRVYPKRKVRISYKLNNHEIVHPTDFIIKDTWIKVNQNLPFLTMGAAVTIGDYAYTIASPYASRIEDQDYDKYLWRFDRTGFSWQKTALPFQPAGSAHITANSGKLYLYETQTNKWRAYDPESNQWTTKADFPGHSRQAPTLFSIDNKIYAGIGSYYIGNELTAAHDFYAFEPGSNKWTRIADYPHPHEYTDPYTRMGTAAFVINKIAYVPCMVGPVESNSYKYDPETNIWTQIANFPSSRWLMSGLFYGQKGYVFNGYGNEDNSWKYDPTTDKWTRLTNYATGREFRPGIAFVLGDRFYVSGVVDQIDDWSLYEAVGQP